MQGLAATAIFFIIVRSAVSVGVGHDILFRGFPNSLLVPTFLDQTVAST